MTQRFLLIWALTATAAALVALGYAMGRATGPGDPVARLPLAPVADSGVTTRNEAPPEARAIPDAFAGLPAEWRSPVDASRRGYAILFAPERGELIVEQCHHRGYVDERGHPVEPGWDFCESLMHGTVLSLTAEAAVVRDSRRNADVEVSLAVAREAGEPVLSVSFGEHRMRLIPGRKNDYFQDIEALAEIGEQKERWFRMSFDREAAARRLAEEGGDANRDVPVYMLPTTSERESGS